MKHPGDSELYPRMWILHQFEFSVHGSDKKLQPFLESVAFKELCFNSVVLDKDVCCENEANKWMVKWKMRSLPPYRERYSKQGSL